MKQMSHLSTILMIMVGFEQTCDICDARHDYMHFTHGQSFTMYDDWEALEYFVSSTKMAFETKLMCKVNIDMLVLCAAYR